VRGRLTGNIKASGKAEITKEAYFTGEIRVRSISVEDGAMLKAVIEFERESQIKKNCVIHRDCFNFLSFKSIQ
jgi:cytoskeletal protein CcmA (bactofilin family)